jgi:hypothetical protein
VCAMDARKVPWFVLHGHLIRGHGFEPWLLVTNLLTSLLLFPFSYKLGPNTSTIDAIVIENRHDD